MFVNKHFANFKVNNLRIVKVKNTKFSGYYFYTNTDILGDFQICISVPLRIPITAISDLNLLDSKPGMTG